MFWFAIVSWTCAEFFYFDYDLTGCRSESSMKEEKQVISCMSFLKDRTIGHVFSTDASSMVFYFEWLI
jgi:hypothetical protein